MRLTIPGRGENLNDGLRHLTIKTVDDNDTTYVVLDIDSHSFRMQLSAFVAIAESLISQIEIERQL